MRRFGRCAGTVCDAALRARAGVRASAKIGDADAGRAVEQMPAPRLDGRISAKSARVLHHRGVQAKNKRRMKAVGIARTKPEAEVSEELKQEAGGNASHQGRTAARYSPKGY